MNQCGTGAAQQPLTLFQGRTSHLYTCEQLGTGSDHGVNNPKMEQEDRDELAGLKRKAFQLSEVEKRKSMAFEVGKEGKFVAKGGNMGKAIAVFTSGGDAQGLTASFYHIYATVKHFYQQEVFLCYQFLEIDHSVKYSRPYQMGLCVLSSHMFLSCLAK